jgi:hypothetical protein
MRTVLRLIAISTALTVAQTASAQDRPRLLSIDAFMSKGVFIGLDPEQMNLRLSLADIERLHFNGNSTNIDEILGLMARSEKMRSRVAEPLEVRGEIPVTLPPNTTGSEAYTTCFYAFNLNGLAVAGSGDSLILIRPETRPEAPRTERKWNRDQILPIRLFRLGYLRSDPILAQYKDKLGTRPGRAILEAKSNTVIVADKASSLEKLQRYIDAEVLEAMGLPAAAGHVAGDGLRPPSPGAIASQASIHFYLMTFARVSRIPMSGSKRPGVAERHYPEANVWLGERGYRALEAEYKRINDFVQLSRDTSVQNWPTLDGERTLSPADQKQLEIHFGVVSPEPRPATPAKRKRR